MKIIKKQMVLSACSGDNIEYEKIAKVMKRIFEGIGEEEKREGEWFEKEINKWRLKTRKLKLTGRKGSSEMVEKRTNNKWIRVQVCHM